MIGYPGSFGFSFSPSHAHCIGVHCDETDLDPERYTTRCSSALNLKHYKQLNGGQQAGHHTKDHKVTNLGNTFIR